MADATQTPEPIEWLIVYEDPKTGLSTTANLYAKDYKESMDKFKGANPTVTRIIGSYVAETVGCDKAFAGIAEKPVPPEGGGTTTTP